jgi:hypothetical protein
MPDEAIAVVVAGSDASGRSAVIGTLLGRAGPVAEPPPGGYVVVRYGRAGRAEAVPAAAPDPDAGRPERPPRRVDVTLAAPLLRHLILIDAPSTDRLGVAGTRVLVDVACRGGGAVYALRSGTRPAAAEVSVLTALVRAGVSVFFALTPDSLGRWRPPARRGRIVLPDVDDPVGAALQAYRGSVSALVPALADAPWHAVDPPAVDAALLRRELIDWASGEALRRAADNAPAGAGTVVLPSGVALRRWRARLDGVHHGAGYAVRHFLAVELAGLQLRCAQHLQRGDDPAGLLRLLDDELHALSLHAEAAIDAAMDRMVQAVLAAAFGEMVPPGARAGLSAAVRKRLTADEPARTLLVTAAGVIVAVPGQAAVTSLRAYPAQVDALLPPSTAVALAGEWWSLLQRQGTGQLCHRCDGLVDELGTALCSEVDRRFDAVRRAVRGVFGQAVDSGILPY